MRLFKRLTSCLENLIKIQIIFIPEHHNKNVLLLNYRIYLICLLFCLLSLGGLCRTFFFLTDQFGSYITTIFQIQKNDRFNSLIRVLNACINQSVSSIHGFPSNAVDFTRNQTVSPEFKSNSSLFPLIGINTIDQLIKAYEFQYNFPPIPQFKHRSTSDLLVFGCPTEGRITSLFGKRTDPVFEGTAIHYGIDIAFCSETPILASADGRVKFVGNKSHWGNVIIIDHAKGYQTIYAHLLKFNTSSEDTVSRGQIIGFLGNTGKSTGPHLHYEIRYFGKPLNPLPFLLPTDIIAD